MPPKLWEEDWAVMDGLGSDPPPRVRQLATKVQVTGAGTELANGLYHREGSSDGQPTFHKPGASITWCGRDSQWYLRMDKDRMRSNNHAYTSLVLPPRPLARWWFEAYKGFECSVLEEPLPKAERDDGMASICTVLHLGEEDCIAKRPFPGCSNIHQLRSEYRFYTELASQCPLRLPRLVTSNWGPEDHEDEGFLLVLERLCQPAWVRVEGSKGCSAEQAAAAAEALGRFHSAFSEQELSWLPSQTTLDRGLMDSLPHGVSETAKLMESTPRAAEACARLAGDRELLEELVARLTQPPLTLLHGDFRTENMRFSRASEAPTVAVFDWGLMSRGRGSSDFTHFLALSLNPATRRECEIEVMQRYVRYAPLVDEFVELQLGLLSVLAKMVVANTWGLDDKTKAVMRRSLLWAAEAVEDWNAGAALPLLSPQQQFSC